MNCPRCAFANSPQARFCGSCGSRLSPACPNCGAELAGDLRFCTACGEPVASTLSPTSSSTAAPSAERRQVSVLFLDLEGFTPLAESLDPEEVRELQSRYFESVRATVARYGGSLEKFIGDAVMAVWGTPIAHEDDAERAVRAALEILAAVSASLTPSGQPLTARAAVATGEAAVALGTRDEGMVSGDLVNTAARLQAIAPAGAVLVDGATRQVVGRSIATEAAGEHQLKGKSVAVAAWSASAVPAGDRRSIDPGHRGPFVGRDTELATLRGMLDSVLADGRLRVVSLTGIAGIGKSRLAWELEREAAGVASPPGWHTARAPAYGEGVAFAPLAAIVRALTGVADTDATEVVHRALRSTLARLVSDPDERAWLEARTLALVEPGSGQAYERGELFAAWRRFLSAAAGVHPLGVVFEDLQWADAGLLDFIEYLADWSRHDPILILTLSRPELLDARPTWGAGLQHFTAVHLDRLPDDAIDALLRALAPELAPELVMRVRERADGVPLYAVEMARMLGEPGSDSTESTAVEIPRSLHALIAARIDALPSTERSLLLTAAVLGRRFRIETLQGVGDGDVASGVHALVRREFLAVDDDPRSPGRGQISFVQDLVREVAYGTLARAERRARHLRIVAFLESLGEAEYTEPIAEHLLAAHRAAARSGAPQDEIATRAVEALRRAAERASALHAPQRAVAQLQDALTLADDPGTRADLMEAAGAAARAAAQFDQAERYLRDAARLRDDAGDIPASARVRAQLAALLLQAQRSAPALAELEAAWDDVAGLNDARSMREIPAQLARAHLLRGDAGEAVRWARQVLDAGDRPPSGEAADPIELDALVTLGTALVQSGDVGDGTAILRAAAERARAGSLGSIELRARNNLAWLVADDDPRATYETARAGYELALRLGNREMVLQMLDGATVVAVDTGDWDWAVAVIDEAQSGPLPAIYRLDLGVTRAQLAAIRGDPDLSSRLDALDALADLDSEFDEAALGAIHYARAFVTLTRGDAPAARHSAELAATSSVEYELPRALALAGRLAAWSGDVAAAGQALAALEAIPGEGRALTAMRSALRAAVGWAAPNGRRPEAAAAWDEAITAFRELGLPLRTAFSLIDRARLLGDADAASQATSLLVELGAGGLTSLVSVEPAKV